MKKLVSIAVAGAMLLALSATTASAAYSLKEKETIVTEFSNLFLSFKISINNLQPHINNPDIGDKGITGEVLAEKAKVQYKLLTGKDFKLSDNPDLRQAQLDLFKAADKIITDAGPTINRKGLGFKGFITAIFARQVARQFSNMSSKWSLKFTAPHNLLRGEGNRADDWEAMVFEKNFRTASWPKNKTFSEVTQGNKYRWMIPLYHEEGCLGCHGGPKGERDMVGYVKEGAKVGDLAGAFSVSFKE